MANNQYEVFYQRFELGIENDGHGSLICSGSPLRTIAGHSVARRSPKREFRIGVAINGSQPLS